MATVVRPAAWHPTADEVRRIVDEMRPVMEDVARRSRQAVSAR